jgi:hypothetical protein
MARLYLIADGGEIARRRAKAPPGRLIEAWADLRIGGAFWVGEESKALLDAGGDPLPARLAVPAEQVAIYYGPNLCDVDSLPRAESLRGRVLSAGGIAAAWATLDRSGQRSGYQAQSPVDPTFHLRRAGGGAGHLWRLFTSRSEAVVYLSELYGDDAEAAEWAQNLAADDFDDLLRRYAVLEPR